ncbi:MAG: hypothetical protein HY660_09195 [Armatimonadetes bacterium]|nr:hypothetical protein [Armatimonadota bacterium]
MRCPPVCPAWRVQWVRGEGAGFSGAHVAGGHAMRDHGQDTGASPPVSCPHCNRLIDRRLIGGGAVCPHCGYPLGATLPPAPRSSSPFSTPPRRDP